MYEISYLPEVIKKEIPRLSLPVKNRITKAIEKKLAINPIVFGKPLRHSLKGLRRLRVDDYRVIYKVHETELKVIIVKIAHRIGIRVVPLVGPSSILLALIASGKNGQNFTFNGYLPKQNAERASKIKAINQTIVKTGYAQLFIETPYRNEVMLKDLVSYCHHEFKLTIAYDVTGTKQKIKTKTIGEWAKAPFKFDKTPCVFVLGN